MQGGWQVGRIYRKQAATDPEREWLWAINGVQGPPEAMQTGGACSSLDQAKAELNANWEKWLAWAKLSPQPD
jgi:hypothetical protein